MMKFKCVRCGSGDVYENHKYAYMAGWDFRGYNGREEICPTCIMKEKQAGQERPEVPVLVETDEE